MIIKPRVQKNVLRNIQIYENSILSNKIKTSCVKLSSADNFNNKMDFLISFRINSSSVFISYLSVLPLNERNQD